MKLSKTTVSVLLSSAAALVCGVLYLLSQNRSRGGKNSAVNAKPSDAGSIKHEKVRDLLEQEFYDL